MKRKLIIIVLLLCSCDNPIIRKKVNEGLVIKKIYYEDNKTLKAEVTFKNDSLIHGYKRYYFSNGQLEQETLFSEGKRNGTFSQFYEDGSYNTKGKYLNDKPDGKWVWFYQNGQIEQIDNYNNGVLVGENLKYEADGSIKEYILFNPLGKACYIRRYNKNEVLKEEGGKEPIIVYKSTKGLNFDLNDTLKTTIYFPNPPDCKVDLKLELKSDKGKILKQKNITTTSDRITFNFLLNEKGYFYFDTYLVLYDTLRKEKNVYTNGLEYSVD